MIAVTKGISAEAIRTQLAGFGRFSRVEASLDTSVPNGTTVVLRKVDIGERLKRWFQSSEERQKHRDHARAALQELRSVRPEFSLLVTGNRGNRYSWSPGELRDILKPAKMILPQRPPLSASVGPARPQAPAAAQFGQAGASRKRSVPAQPGMHFLKNSLMSLRADRFIVPLSEAEDTVLPTVAEKDVRKKHLTAFAPGQVITIDDSLIGDFTMLSPQQVGARFFALLDGMHGTVALCPPVCREEQMEAIVMAVRDACGKNAGLSVSFAVKESEQRDKVTQAYGRVVGAEEDLRPLDIDDDNDIEAIDPSALWKTA